MITLLPHWLFQVTVTLATLSFFCRRPTILAILDFVNAINIKDETCESFSDNSSTAIVQDDMSREDVIDIPQSARFEDPIVKGLLGQGKSRIIFSLTLNMARAQILLMMENGTTLATLSQDNFLTDIKVCIPPHTPTPLFNAQVTENLILVFLNI